ncbi:MAG: zinc-ribbon domain-containing protein [Eubacteriales bacterium]
MFISDSSVETDLPSTYQLFSKGNFCSKCGNSIMPSNKFCGNCGNAL